jgi:hypothetical protein
MDTNSHYGHLSVREGRCLRVAKNFFGLSRWGDASPASPMVYPRLLVGEYKVNFADVTVTVRVKFTLKFFSVYSFCHLLPQFLVNCTFTLTSPPPPQGLIRCFKYMMVRCFHIPGGSGLSKKSFRHENWCMNVLILLIKMH